MAIVVRATSDGFEVAEDDRALSTHDTLREALDAARARIATREKTHFLRNPDTGAEHGAWRWLPATEEEPVAIGGVRIDAKAIEEMAASLNARSTPIPVDGGPTPDGHLASEVHGTATSKGGAPANGWAHWAVVAVGADGVHELYLWAELVPSVAREIDAGRIALGSVHFGFDRLEGEAPRSCVLVSHALTNDPAVTSLAPANSVRVGERDLRSARRTSALVNARLSATRSREETKTMTDKNEGERTETETPAETEAARSMLDAAKILEALGLGVDADEAAILAAIADLKKASASGEAASTEGEREAARSRDALTLQTLRTQNAELAARLSKIEPMVAAAQKREREDAIRSALAAKGITDAARTASYLEHGEKFGLESARSAIDAVSVPPGGERLFKSAPSRGAAPETTNVEAVRTTERKRAVADAEAEVRKEQPGIEAHRALSLARSRVRSQRPELFGVATHNETASD
jgi:hypothetical protein